MKKTRVVTSAINEELARKLAEIKDRVSSKLTVKTNTNVNKKVQIKTVSCKIPTKSVPKIMQVKEKTVKKLCKNYQSG